MHNIIIINIKYFKKIYFFVLLFNISIKLLYNFGIAIASNGYDNIVNNTYKNIVFLLFMKYDSNILNIYIFIYILKIF